MLECTPGDWKAIEIANGWIVGVEFPDDNPNIVGIQPIVLKMAEENQEANARRIAAAPEMEAALEAVTRTAASMDINVIEQVWAALAKAKGVGT